MYKLFQHSDYKVAGEVEYTQTIGNNTVIHSQKHFPDAVISTKYTRREITNKVGKHAYYS